MVVPSTSIEEAPVVGSRACALALTQTTTVPMIATPMLASSTQYPTSYEPNAVWPIRTPIHVRVQAAAPAIRACGVQARRQPVPKSAITPTVAAPANTCSRPPTCSIGFSAPSQISRNSRVCALAWKKVPAEIRKEASDHESSHAEQNDHVAAGGWTRVRARLHPAIVRT